MVQSMTGFGKYVVQFPSKKITIEIKSLNSKILDLSVRVPSDYKAKEIALRNLIAKKIERGKVEISITSEIMYEETATKINASVVKEYIRQLQTILPQADATELMKMAVRMPDVLKYEINQIDEKEWNEIQKAIDQTILIFTEYRTTEGKALQNDLEQRIEKIRLLITQIVSLDKERIQTIKTRLNEALNNLKITIDENRFEQELIYYIEKYDITEEKVRLESHLDYFWQTMITENSIGRKLGFIAQEIGREINTMGSKANHSQMQKLVVQMKDELEKIKEQILNVL